MQHTRLDDKRHSTCAAFVALGVVFCWLGAPLGWAQAPTFNVTAHSALETFRAEELPRGDAREIRLSAAGGETESFQLAVVNRSPETLRDIRIAVSGPTGVSATAYVAGAVNVAKPGRSGGAPPGRYFDLLRPIGGERVPSGQYLPYWIDLKVDAAAPPGPQNGQVRVTTSAGVQVLPIRLQVRGFQLPVVPSLKLAFACGLSWMEAYYGKRLTRGQIHAAQAVMLEHRLGPVPMWGKGAELFDDEAGLKRCLDLGMNIVLLTCGGETDEQIERSLDALEPKIALLRRLGALDRTYLFGYDEITMSAPDRILAMRKAYERFHQRHPEILRINTSQPNPRLEGFVDIFVVPTARFVATMAQSKEVWWYSVGADRLPQEPDFRIDFPAMAQRGYFLADWKAGVQGHLYWAVQREWPANKDVRDKNHPEHEWRLGYQNVNSKAWTEANGGGNLFYPDATGGMLPTPRVKRIRDGIEDYEYLAQLGTAAAALAQCKPPGWQGLAETARRLLAVPDDVVRIGAGWREGWTVPCAGVAACSSTTHPAAIHSGRQALRILPDRAGVSVVQDLPVTLGKEGVFSGWIKTNDLAGAARLTAEYRDAQGQTLQRWQSEPATGSTRKFVKREVALPEPPAGAKTLRVGLTARCETASADAKSPLQKTFFDHLTLRVGASDAPLVNPGFEADALRVNVDPAPLLEYRDRVAECLERCMIVLRRTAQCPNHK